MRRSWPGDFIFSRYIQKLEIPRNQSYLFRYRKGRSSRTVHRPPRTCWWKRNGWWYTIVDGCKTKYWNQFHLQRSDILYVKVNIIWSWTILNMCHIIWLYRPYFMVHIIQSQWPKFWLICRESVSRWRIGPDWIIM